MAFFLLARKLSPSPSPSFLEFPTAQSPLTLLSLLRLSTDAPQPNNLPFIAQYLISSLDFSPDRAMKVATLSHLSPIKTSGRPEAVVRFLKETGLTNSQIKSVISYEPNLLSCNVSKYLEPRVHLLMDVGFTGQTLTRLIQLNPSLLVMKCTLARLQFWRDYTGNTDALLKILQRNRRLLNLDIDKAVMPNINFLKNYGFSDADLRKVLFSIGGRLKNVDWTKKLLEETEALGFAPKSRMFLYALPVVGRSNRDTIMRKLAFLKNNYGWSEEEVHAAFRRFPYIVNLSEITLKSKMDFLLGCVRLTNQDISSRPQLLGYSLERKLEPRHRVLSVLKLKGHKTSVGLSRVFGVTEKYFYEKFVRAYKKEIPELEEVYAAASQEKRDLF